MVVPVKTPKMKFGTQTPGRFGFFLVEDAGDGDVGLEMGFSGNPPKETNMTTKPTNTDPRAAT